MNVWGGGGGRVGCYTGINLSVCSSVSVKAWVGVLVTFSDNSSSFSHNIFKRLFPQAVTEVVIVWVKGLKRLYKIKFLRNDFEKL